MSARLFIGFLKVFLVVIGLLSAPVLRAQNLIGDSWTAPASPLGGGIIGDMTTKGSEYWAVAVNSVYKSSNLTSWSKVPTTGLQDTLQGIRWTGTRFVSVGLAAWTSPDGIAWTRRHTFYPYTAMGMANRGETAIAIGNLGRVYRSTDGGQTWSVTALGESYEFTSVAATPTHFAIAGKRGVIFNSSDGITWTERSSGTSYGFLDMAYAGTRLVAVGEELTVATSTDNGNTWASAQAATGTGNAFRAVAGDASMTVICASRLIAYGANPSQLSTLQVAQLPEFQTEFTCAVRGSSGWACGGYGGGLITATSPSAWTLRNPSFAYSFRSGVRTSDNFVIAGFPGDKIVRSTDGVAWSTGTSGIPATDAALCMAWSGSRLVAGGVTGKIYTTASSTGSSFVETPSGTGNRLNACVWTGSQFFIFGNNGTILSSNNGTSWTTRTSGTTAHLGAGGSNGLSGAGAIHIAAGYNPSAFGNEGVILTSTNNGISWTQTTSVSNAAFACAGWNGSYFTVAGTQGVILTSPDGVVWTRRAVNPSPSGEPFSKVVLGMTWAGTNWIGTTQTGGSILSTDGVEWKSQHFPADGPLNSVVYSSPRAVAFGEWGLLFNSVSTPPRAPSILVPPMDSSVAVGENHIIACVADGTPELTYKWRRNGQEIPTALNNYVLFNAATVFDSGTYDVTVTGPGGSVTSASAAFRVRAPPGIVSPPVPLTVPSGGTATFAIEAVGVGPITYQWFKVGTGSLNGRTAATLSLTGVNLADAGEYYVEATNEYGTTSSSTALLAVTVPLEIALDLSSGTAVQTSINPWFGTTQSSYDGADSAQSGAIPDGGITSVEMSVTGVSSVSFWWKVSSEANFDYLSFSVNSNVAYVKSGTFAGWELQTQSLDPAAVNVLRWSYSKDGSAISGSDCGWVDQITLTPATPLTDFPWWANSLPAGRRALTDRNGPLQITNSLAYVLGMNPLTAKRADLPALEQNGTQWSLLYSRTRRTSGTSYLVEWSTNPANPASWNTAGVTHEQTASATEKTSWRAKVTPPAGQRFFMRLRAILDDSSN